MENPDQKQEYQLEGPKPATSLAGNNNALAHYEQSRGFDVISVYSLNPRKYCDGVWSGCSKTVSDELEVVHNNAARAVATTSGQAPPPIP